MYGQTMIKKRKTGKRPLEAEARPRAQEMNENDTMDEIEPTASSTLREEGRTRANKLGRKMASLCSIYDVNIIGFAQKHEPGFVEDLSRNMCLVLADTTYSVQSNRDNDHAGYSVFNSNDTKNISKVFKDFLKSSAHGYVF